VNEQPALAPVSVPRPRLPAKSRDPYGWAQPQQQTQDPA
jgi:hypothetical protein